MANKPEAEAGLRTNLTRWQIIVASPMYRNHRWNKADEMKAFWDRYPFPETSEVLFIDAWRSLVEWYLEESLVIGERRAFWGLVHRLTDMPTNDDVAWIQTWLYQYLRVREDFEFPCWMEDLWD